MPPPTLALPTGILNPYEILDISNRATDDEIKKAFKNLARKLHPDKLVKASVEEKAAAEIRFMKVKASHEFLCDEGQKNLYDTMVAKKENSVKRKVEREEAMDGARRAMKRRLDEEEERAAPTARHSQTQVDEMRKENLARRQAHATHQQQRSEEASAQARQNRHDLSLRTVKIKWKRTAHSHSEDSLATLFGSLGTVESVEFVGDKGNAAKLVFSDVGEASKAVSTYAASKTMKVSLGSKPLEWNKPSQVPTFVRPEGTGISARDLESLADLEARRRVERSERNRQLAEELLGGGEVPLEQHPRRNEGSASSYAFHVPLSAEALLEKERHVFAKFRTSS